MEISKWNNEDSKYKSGVMVRVSPEEAVCIIKSLSTQIINKSPNNGREEFVADDRVYFSIAVHQIDDKED